MRNVKLTSRERVNRMFARQDQDSVPRMESFWDDTLKRWRGEGMTGDPNEDLGNDFASLCWSEPFPYRDQFVVIAEDDETQTVRDAWGQVNRYWKHRQGTPEHISFPVNEKRDWECVLKPLLLSNPPSVDVDASRRAFARGRRSGRWCHLTGLETFEMTRHVLGDELTMITMLDDPEWFVDVSRTLTDLVIRDLDTLWNAGVQPDGLWIYGDMAYRRGLMCGPPLYRELVWPDHARMVNWAHERGLPFIYHTDGDVNGVIEDYIRAGFDCLQPLEAKAGMDVRDLCPRYGDRICFFGNVDVMVMATNDHDLIESEVRTKLDAGKASLGYAYHSDHSVPPSVSWETYQFVIDLVDRYGNY